MSAALTPRHGFAAESFPCVRPLSVYLLLSYPRGGSFTGEVKLAATDEDRTIRVSRFTASFDHGMVHALTVDLGDCTFPEPGSYSVEIRFVTTSAAVLKGEESLSV